MKKAFFLLLLTFTGTFALYSQNIDSIARVARNSKNDSTAVTMLNAIAYFSVFNDTKRAYSTLQEAKRRAIKAKLHYNYVELTNTEGVYHDVTGNRDSARYFFEKAIRLSKKQGFLNLETRTVNNLGMLNWNQGNFNEALNYFFKALKLNEKLPEGKKVANATMYSNIGLIYQEMNLYDKALQYHKMAYKYRVAHEHDKFMDIPGSLNNMAICYDRLGQNKLAEDTYKQGIEVAKKYNNRIEYYKLLEGYSGLLVENSQHAQAVKLLLEILNHPPEISFPPKSQLSLYSELTNAYNNLNQPKTAFAYAQKGLAVLEQNPDLKNYSGDLYLGLSHACYNLGDAVKGQLYSVKFAETTRGLFSEENASKMADLEVKYETEKKEKLIAENKARLLKIEAEARQKNYMLMILLFFIAFLSVIGYLLFRQQQLKNRQMEKEFELKSALAEIENQNRLQEQRLTISRDLHDNIGAQLTFIISSLDNLKYRLTENIPAVGNKLEGISNFTQQTIIELRDTIWAMNTKHITFEDLRARILNFMEKAQEANENIDFQFKIDPLLMDVELSSVTGMNIYRTIQEAVNNAIKHSAATKMEIIVFDEQDMVSIIMRDNGRGFDRDATIAGNGLQNMEKRMEGIGGSFAITSDPGEGTIITIHLNKKMQSA